MSKSYKVIYKKNAKKFIEKHKAEGFFFFKTFSEIAIREENMVFHDIKKLHGTKRRYRLRVGKYRAIFEINNSKLIILVLEIKSRGQIYK